MFANMAKIKLMLMIMLWGSMFSLSFSTSQEKEDDIGDHHHHHHHHHHEELIAQQQNERNLYDFYVSYSCSCYSCSCGKGCSTTCCSTCYTYYSYCASGRYYPNGYIVHTSSCNACPGGQYQDSTGQASCKTCPAGYYCPSTALNYTTACPAGYYCPSAAINYTACPAGYYCPSTSGNQIACPINTYSNSTAARCTNCSVGKISTENISSTSCMFTPSPVPSYAPTPVPVPLPSTLPSAIPTILPSELPTIRPSLAPSLVPTSLPTPVPHPLPSLLPSALPTSLPSRLPTQVPTSPTNLPTSLPTIAPTMCLDTSPYCDLVKEFCDTAFCDTCPQAHNCDVTCNFADCVFPTSLPSPLPTSVPTSLPTPHPTSVPTISPSYLPTDPPSRLPTMTPSSEPTAEPTLYPTGLPTVPPTHVPSSSPTHLPTFICAGLDPAQYLLTLSDYGGDGWGGVEIAVKDSTGAMTYSTTLASGSSRRQWLCLATDCYRIAINSTDVQISWRIEDNVGISVSGDAPTSDTVCTNSTSFANTPTIQPTVSLLPSFLPTPLPTSIPLPVPTRLPTLVPTRSPTAPPTPYPSPLPTNSPTENCMDGEYLLGTTCRDCPAGRYVTVSMAAVGARFPSECDSCSTGYYSRAGAAECIVCPEGKYSNFAKSDCVQCQSGQYANITAQACYNCSAGEYAPVALNNACIMCGAGAATGLDISATDCDSCSPGTYAVGDGVVNECRDCPKGTYSESRASSCITCDVGTYAASNRSSSCQDCNAGTSTLSLTSAVKCTDCLAGEYSHTRAGECLDCPVGHYSNQAGTGQCIGCDTGTFTNETASTSCHPCLNGTYQESSSQATCVKCEVGKFAPALSSKYCFTCEDGHTSVEGAAQCERCNPGYFWGYAKASDSWSCEVCPYGATCSGGIYQPVAQAGFWIDRVAAAADPSLVKFAYPCQRQTCSKLNADTANRRLASNDCLLLSNFSSPACIDDDLFCDVGSSGPLCGSCNEAWNYDAQSKRCAPCGETTTWTQAFASLFICLAVFGVIWSLRKGVIYVPPPLRAYTNGKAYVKSFSLNVVLHINRAALKLMVSTYQIVMSVGSNLEMTFPEPYTTFSAWMGFVQLDFFSLDCLKSTYYISVYTTCSFPILFVAFIWLIFLIRVMIYRNSNHDDDNEEEGKSPNTDDEEDEEDEKIVQIRNQHINISLLVVFIVLPPVAKKQFRALDCMYLEDGSSYLRDDTGIDCKSFGYQRFALINGLLIVVYQSIPLLYIILLCRVKEKLRPLSGENETPEEALMRRDSDKDLDSIRFLFNDTKSNRWFFEVMEFYRRIVFTGGLPLMSRDSSIIAYIGCLMGLASVVYFRELLPFRTEWTNFIAVTCQYVILLVFLAALMIETDSRELFTFSDFSFGIFLILVNVSILILVVYGGLLRYRIAQENEASVKELSIESINSSEMPSKMNVLAKSVASSHVLVYYYTSLSEAQLMLEEKGIPALNLPVTLTTITPWRKQMMGEDKPITVGERGGVVVSLNSPHKLTKMHDSSLSYMNRFAQSKEVVFCVSVPRHMLWALQFKESEVTEASTKLKRNLLIRGTSLDQLPDTPQSQESINHLRLIPVELLEAMGEKIVFSQTRQKRGHANVVEVVVENRSDLELQKLPLRNVEAIFQLRQVDEAVDQQQYSPMELKHATTQNPKPIINAVINMTRPMKMHQPTYYEEYASLLKGARDACESLNLIPLYCYTSNIVASDIVVRGLHLSPRSQQEIGVFLTLKSPCSLGLGTDSFEFQVLSHLYGDGPAHFYQHKGLVDTVLIYGAEPYCLEKSWSNNRVIYGSDHFRDLAPQTENFHFRADRILMGLQVIGEMPSHYHHHNYKPSKKSVSLKSSGKSPKFNGKSPKFNGKSPKRRPSQDFMSPRNMLSPKNSDNGEDEEDNIEISEEEREREIAIDDKLSTILTQVELEAEHNSLQIDTLDLEEDRTSDEWLFKQSPLKRKVSSKQASSSSVNRSFDNLSVELV